MAKEFYSVGKFQIPASFILHQFQIRTPLKFQAIPLGAKYGRRFMVVPEDIDIKTVTTFEVLETLNPVFLTRRQADLIYKGQEHKERPAAPNIEEQMNRLNLKTPTRQFIMRFFDEITDPAFWPSDFSHTPGDWKINRMPLEFLQHYFPKIKTKEDIFQLSVSSVLKNRAWKLLTTPILTILLDDQDIFGLPVGYARIITTGERIKKYVAKPPPLFFKNEYNLPAEFELSLKEELVSEERERIGFLSERAALLVVCLTYLGYGKNNSAIISSLIEHIVQPLLDAPTDRGIVRVVRETFPLQQKMVDIEQ